MKEERISNIVFDASVYPRLSVDSDHVFNICESIKAGCQLPSIVVCEKTLRIVDGVHRLEALKRIIGSGGFITVIAKKYDDDSEMFCDAMRYNAKHGRNLSGDDRRHAAQLAAKLEIDIDRIAGSLSISRTLAGGLIAAKEFSGSKITTVPCVTNNNKSSRRESAKPSLKKPIYNQEHLPRERLNKLSRRNGDAESNKAEELAFLLDDAASAIDYTEIDLSRVHKMSSLSVALIKLRKSVESAIKKIGIKR